jgi:hypothetical protein
MGVGKYLVEGIREEDVISAQSVVEICGWWEKDREVEGRRIYSCSGE